MIKYSKIFVQRKHVENDSLYYFFFFFSPEDVRILASTQSNQQVTGLKANKAVLEVFLRIALEYRMELTTSDCKAMKRREVFQKELEENIENGCTGSC